MQDRLFLEFGVEEEDLLKAVVDTQVQKDPEVLKLLEQNMKKLPPEVMQRLSSEVIYG